MNGRPSGAKRHPQRWNANAPATAMATATTMPAVVRSTSRARKGIARDLPERAARNVVSVSPLAMPDADGDTVAAIDQLTTATVPGIGAGPGPEGTAAEEGLSQPFPGKSGFKLMHVANGRALIEDASGMYIVRIGSVLPDNTRLATLEQRDGHWVMITSSGEMYQAN